MRCPKAAPKWAKAKAPWVAPAKPRRHFMMAETAELIALGHAHRQLGRRHRCPANLQQAAKQGLQAGQNRAYKLAK
ncbi:MAG: hypothetical protein R2857_01960 [Vampirovibrionales bacterium]